MFRHLKLNKGYTLLNTLLSLTILIVISPLFLYLIKPFVSLMPYDYFRNYEMSQFKFFIEIELNHSKELSFEQNKIHFHRYDHTVITFEKYENTIRRRVDGQGHEIMMYNVKDFIISKINDNTLKIMVERNDHDEKNKDFFYIKIT